MRKVKINFQSLDSIRKPEGLQIIAKIILVLISFFILGLFITPWQQTTKGHGKVIALDPNERIQNINSGVAGRIKKWHIKEGDQVKKGDLIVELEDLDPSFMERLLTEREAAYSKLQAIKIAAETSSLNYKRQKELFQKGLSSRVKFEKAKIDYKKIISEEASAAAKLVSIETKLSRQMTQEVRAPLDGQVLKIFQGAGNVIIGEGDVLAIFLPRSVKQAVEIFVSGNDLPLVLPGKKVRLQFEGWPAVQVSGWPSLAIGTFPGVVKAIDPSTNSQGKIRVLIVPDSEDAFRWPDSRFLRQGTKVYGWVLLDVVKLGYELWRKFNDFPAQMTDIYFDELQEMKQKNEKSKKSK